MVEESGAKPVSMYYSFDDILSRNGVFNFIIGGRGIGKTYGAKKIAIDTYLETGKQFIYLRRYKSELRTAKTFFDDLAHLYPGYSFRVNGRIFQMKESDDPNDKEYPWHDMGYLRSLSTAQTEKSTVYNKVKWIIFDEIILEKGPTNYLPMEYEAFINFYFTVDRGNDRVTCLLLSNAVSINNPYFLAEGINDDREWCKRKKGFIVVHFPKSEEFKEHINKTRFGQFISNSAYSDYAVNNQFADNQTDLVEDKPTNASYKYSLLMNNINLSVWTVNRPDGMYYYVQKKQPKNKVQFTTDLENVNNECVYLERNSSILQGFRGAYNRGRMRFDSPPTRLAAIQAYKR